MKISVHKTALLVALMFNRSQLKRARLTHKTICRISGRTALRSQFIVQLQAELDDLGFILFESGRGFGLIKYSLLDGALVLSESRYIDDELFEIDVNGDYDFKDIKRELGLSQASEETEKRPDVDNDDWNFDDDDEEDEPAPIKKPKKTRDKKAKKFTRVEHDDVEDDNEDWNF